ncbi:MAG: undecaprenyldiphospho-muramoylpentapeptide beta-N-acetylglucosaminyltransferase [Armatimonadota bacterium]|nr:undecaprenyldiphospho-muramoylpentapeptide beta-N-acetylglucosaminyltransferase [Armatimonadota bacterium]
MRIVITGGGTGGHIYPGLAIAERLREEGWTEVLFIGGDRLEREIVPRAGVPFVSIPAAQLPRRPGPRAILALLRTARGAVQAARLLRKMRPHAVVATGGYASAPVALAALLLGIPLLLQEQNALPGLTNRLVARWAARIAVAHGEAGKLFPPGKVVVTGIPIRPALLLGSRERAQVKFGLDPEKATVLVLGGSQGAQVLNRAILEALPYLDGLGVQVLHQTGTAHICWVREEAERLGQQGLSVSYVPFPYLELEEMADAYASADLVVCRAGATTLAEITAVGLPAILVPYPYAAEGHQEQNARILEEAGAAVVLLQNELNGPRLAGEISRLLRDRSLLRAMADASKRCGRPDATREVVHLILELARGGRDGMG